MPNTETNLLNAVPTINPALNISTAGRSQSATTIIETSNLYGLFNPGLDVKVSNDDKGRGRGVYSKFLRKPGELEYSRAV